MKCIGRENQRNFLDEFGKQLGFKQMNDWYNITSKKIIENGGSGLLNKYGNSPSKLIMSIYEIINGNNLISIQHKDIGIIKKIKEIF